MTKPKMDYCYTVKFLYKGVKDIFNLESSKILDADDVFYTISHELKKTIENYRESNLQILDFYLNNN